VLKGLNRRSFEDKLQANIHRRLNGLGQFRVYTRQSTTYVEPMGEDCDMDGAYEAMKKVFGVVGLSRARACEKDKDAILQACKEYLDDRLSTAKTFKVETKRADKTFPMTSIQLSQYVGGELHEAYENLAVDVHHPELTVFVEIRDYAAFVHADPEQGAGGLPVGINGRAVSLLSGGIDSPVSSYMIAKRGVALEMVHFFSYPYTSPEAKEKVLELARLLTPWCGRLTVHVVPFTAIQEELRRSCPEELFTIVMRRFMMRIAEKVALRCGAKALVTGECLGQVASQTMEALQCTGGVVTLPVLRPVIGMDKEEIVQISRKIGTYQTSILPYEDCCTVFTPRHPRLRPIPTEVEQAEAKLDISAMVDAAVDGIERIQV
jgi:thiamine biosynthesis protein ThiI